MAGGIDTSNRKPRRLRGTPALKLINIYSFITLTVACGIGYMFFKRPKTTAFVEKHFSDKENEKFEREIEERAFMLSNQVVGQKSSGEIRKILRHKKKYETELGDRELKNNSQFSNSHISRFFSQSIASNDVSNQEKNASKDDVIDECWQGASDDCNKLEQANTNGINEYSEKSNNGIDKHSDKKELKSVHRSDKTLSVDSKSTIKSFFSNEQNDSMADFEIPTKVPKRVSKLTASKVIKKPRARRKQPDIRKALTSKGDDISTDYSHLPEDAQLEWALAMSKAESQANEGSDQPINLEAFEFKALNAKMYKDIFELFNIPKKKNARYKWNSKCTQLTRRKDDVQKKKICEKIEELLLNNIIVESSQSERPQSPRYFDLTEYTPHEIHSKKLQRICVSERILYEINGCEEHTKNNIRLYYTNNLVDCSELESGVLLRDWSKIPGRDSIFDGISNSVGEIDKISSQTDTVEDCDIIDKPQEKTINCFNAQYSATETPMEIEVQEKNDERECEERQYQFVNEHSQNEATSSADDADANADKDATIIIDTDNIQLTVDAINSKIRCSQKIADIFQTTVVTYGAPTHATRAPSPDLFSDDDDDADDDDDDDNDIEMTDEIQGKNDEASRKKNSFRVPIDEDTVETTSSDVIVISSSDCNSNPVPASNQSTQSMLQIDSEEMKNNDNTVVETIDLLDIDSENVIDDPIQLSVNDYEHLPQMEKIFDVCNYEYENEDFIEPVHREKPNTSVESSENGEVLTKKLSFTERLELYEKDMMNGFTAELPAECYSNSQSQMQSQESIVLSDDEINYSINKGGEHEPDRLEQVDNIADNEFYNYYLPSPIDFNLLDPNSNLEPEEKLMNQSVCNILEKTFEHGNSPVGASTKRKSIGAKSLKKVNSETVLGSRYGNVMPSTSTSTTNRFKLMPDKPNRTPENKSKPLSSQPTVETRTDLSNEDYYIRLGSVSPKPNYEQMDTTTIELELRKFGLKPSLRRRQAIICLEYIYNRTHPVLENVTHLPEITQMTETKDIPKYNDEDSGREINFNIGFSAYNLVDEVIKKHEVNRIFLPSALRAKKPWCLEPLHIAWHNLIAANHELRKAVLLYEPINLIELKKFFKSIEMTFDNRDLISFLDMHCITFRMNRPTKE